MKNKLITALIICFMCFTMIFGAGCSLLDSASNEGGDLSGQIEDPDTGDYDSGQEYMPANEAYSGFTIVQGTDTEIQVVDPISGTNMNFSAMVSRQIEKFIEDILARLDSVWGTRISDNKIIPGGSYTLAIGEASHYAVIKPGDEILRGNGTSYTWIKPDGTSVTVTAADLTFDVSNPAVFALNSDLISSNFSFEDAINGGRYWDADASDFTGAVADSALYNWTVSTGSSYSLSTDTVLKTSLKLAIANILAYGQHNASSNLSKCLTDIDHLGFLQVEDISGAIQDEVERISGYILSNIIGTSALTKDNECLAALRSSLTNNILTSSSTISQLGHNYRGYALLVPEIVKTAVTNNFATITGDATVAYNSDYLVYPKLPKVTAENFIFSDSDNEDMDFIWMNDHKEIKSITFMPKVDIPVVSFMLAFEAKGLNEEGEWANINVQLAVTFTMVTGGKTVLDNAVVSGIGATNGVVNIKQGVYHGELNDNSAIFNVSNAVKDAVKNNSLPADAPADIPANGIVTVGIYDGHNPVGAIDLYGGDYTTYANANGVGSNARLYAGNNYIQMNFSIVSATITQGTTVIPFGGTVLLRLAVGDPIS